MSSRHPTMPSIAAGAALAPFLLLLPPSGGALPSGGAERPPAAEDGAARRAPLDSPGCWVRGAREDLELRISELDSASVELGGDTAKVCYSRPRKLDRPIMGRLVPYDEPWRLGANEATAVHVPFPAEIAGVEVEPGWYSLYAIPGPESWEIVVNREARRWGIPIDREVRERDVGSGTVPVESLPETVERLTVRLEAVSRDSAEMAISWERTRVRTAILRRDRGGADGPQPSSGASRASPLPASASSRPSSR